MIYKDEDDLFNHPLNFAPPIDTGLATSSLTPPGLFFSDSTTPVTPSLLSPSQVGYASFPSLFNVSPPASAHALGPITEVYHTFPSSAPVSPYPAQLSPWHIANAVRILSFILHSLVLTVSTISNHLQSQSVSSHLASTNKAPWCHRSDTSHTPPVTDAATLKRSNSSQASTFICRSPMNQGYP
jgi:hypothetical protein